MTKLQNGELLKEIYDSVKKIETSVAVIESGQKNQDKLIDKHDKDINTLKFKILPLVGAIGIIIAIVVGASHK